MALRMLTDEEIGQRLRWLRRAADLNGRQLAEALGSNDAGLTSKLEGGQRPFSYRRLTSLANALAGEGLLKGTTPEEVLAILEGRLDAFAAELPDGSSTQMSYFAEMGLLGDKE